MMKLSFRDKSILATMILIAVLFAGTTKLMLPVMGDASTLQEQIDQLKGTDFTALDTKLVDAEAKNTAGLKEINEIKQSEDGNSMSPQTFLIFVTSESKANQTKLVKFNDLGVNESNGVWRQRYDLELRGNMSNINEVLSKIDESEVKYSVGSMSLRADDDYPFLERPFDAETELEWYADPIPEETLEDEDSLSEDELSLEDESLFDDDWLLDYDWIPEDDFDPSFFLEPQSPMPDTQETTEEMNEITDVERDTEADAEVSVEIDVAPDAELEQGTEVEPRQENDIVTEPEIDVETGADNLLPNTPIIDTQETMPPVSDEIRAQFQEQILNLPPAPNFETETQAISVELMSYKPAKPKFVTLGADMQNSDSDTQYSGSDIQNSESDTEHTYNSSKPTSNYKSSDVFRLTITIEFIMYSDPRTGGGSFNNVMV